MSLLIAPVKERRPSATSAKRSRRPLRGHDRVMFLRDGRRLGYAEFGDQTGRPVFFFHGFGTSRVVCPPDDRPARELGIRLIAVDRPGIGLSDPKPGRQLMDWPSDVAEFADQLGIRDHSIVGWSGGGPYALACARVLGKRVKSVAVVSSPAPFAGTPERDHLRRFEKTAASAARAPWVIRLAMWHWGRLQRRDAERFFEKSVAEMCAADQEVLADSTLRDLMIDNSAELYRQGGRGMYDEALVLARPWGFDLRELDVPVHVWHGEQDAIVPKTMTDYLARYIPRVVLHRYSDEGHHLLYSRWREILSAVA